MGIGMGTALGISKQIGRAAGVAALAALLVGGTSRGAAAQSAEDFYRARPNMKLIVSSTAGGGYDMMARIAARYFSKYLPGEPSIVVQNMPGGGGIVATNHLYAVAPKDGTTFGHIDRGNGAFEFTLEATHPLFGCFIRQRALFSDVGPEHPAR